MAKLSELTVTVTTTYSVNPDGTQKDLVYQSEPSYTVPGIKYQSVEHALSEVEDDSNGPVAGEFVDVEKDDGEK